MTSEVHSLVRHTHWLGHSSFRIGDPDERPILYIDPWRLPDGEPPADIILVSHEHYDHCSPADVETIRTSDTIVVSSPAAAKVLGPGTLVLRAWQSAPTIGGLSLRAVPAYSFDKPSHAKDNDGLGFVITFRDHTALYFAGDTDLVPEMAHIQCDIALLPIGGVETMTVEEAVEAARQLSPEVAVPMHYGSGVAGAPLDGKLFCGLVKPPVQAVLLPNEGKQGPATGPLG
jgi:L-ascorbate metabolism protein UlaG (beta-lactamase superfamily)